MDSRKAIQKVKTKNQVNVSFINPCNTKLLKATTNLEALVRYFFYLTSCPASERGKSEKFQSLFNNFFSLSLSTQTPHARIHIYIKNTRNKNATRRRHEHPPPPQREFSYRRAAKARLLRDVCDEHRDKVDGHVRDKKCIFSSGGIVVFKDGL